MGIRLHVAPQLIPKEFVSVITKPDHEAAHFCIGELIRGIPQGLIIYAGRIQYNHLNDDNLYPIPKLVFEMLAKNHSWPVQGVKDPAFDLETRNLQNYAANILNILQWKSYVQYLATMNKLLSIE